MMDTTTRRKPATNQMSIALPTQIYFLSLIWTHLKILATSVLLLNVAASISAQQIPPPQTPYHFLAYPQTPPNPDSKLEGPIAVQQKSPQGPGLDLIEFNKLRFEKDHNHSGGNKASEAQLRDGLIIETKLSALPERMLAQLPEDVTKQLFEAISTDPSLMISSRQSAVDQLAANLPLAGINFGDITDDPDGASIERLTKSCLTVHASSARPEQLNVTFHLYTRNNPYVPFLIGPQITRDELIKGSPFDVGKPIKWITHGFHTNVDKSEWMVEAKNKILTFEDANVILTDWRRGASPALAFYPKAAANAHVVAKMIVKILRRLRNDISLSRVHLIGHSLGAHIMGFVGSAFTEEHLHMQQQMLAKKSDSDIFWKELEASQAANAQNLPLIGKVTACDPALPCFGPSSTAANNLLPGAQAAAAMQTRPDPTQRDWELPDWTPTLWTHLRPDSAVVVEVMHSNPGVMGYSDPLGDFDFYPNGFEKQPGCGQQHQQSQQQQQSPPISPLGPQYRPLETQMRSLSHAGPMVRTKRQIIGNLMSSLFSRSSEASPVDQQAGNRLTLDKLIKPIKDFFHGYTCSHHRSVEYMVESMYYEHIPQDRRLDRDAVCQMIGYRCSDYMSFKKGFCYRCDSEHDCRAFMMRNPSTAGLVFPVAQAMPPPPDVKVGARSLSPRQFMLDKFQVRLASSPLLKGSNTSGVSKRTLPTYNRFKHHNLMPKQRNLYFFDTKAQKSFCLHHYHLHVKYRWFRVRESLAIEGLRIVGTLGNITLGSAITFNRFSMQSYTVLLTETMFLGQIEALIVLGGQLRPNLIDFIEVTYMSNLDPRVRNLGSAQLCRSQQQNKPLVADTSMANSSPESFESSNATNFVRCTVKMV